MRKYARRSSVSKFAGASASAREDKDEDEEGRHTQK